MQVRQYTTQNSLVIADVINALKSKFQKSWIISSKLNAEQIDYLNYIFQISETPALPQQEERKALPQAQIEQPQAEPEISQQQVQTEQPLQTEQQGEQQQVNDAPIQTTSNNDVALTKSDLEAIKTIRETFGEQGVQVFLQKKRQDLIVNKATTEALRQHDEQKLYEEVKLPDFSRDVERRVRFANDIREPDSPKNDQKICWYCRHKCE